MSVRRQFARTLLVTGVVATVGASPLSAEADDEATITGSIVGVGSAIVGGVSEIRPEETPVAGLGGGAEFSTWGDGVNVRSEPSTSSDIVTTLDGPTAIAVDCQTQGELVSESGYTNDWWSYIPDLGGYISNIYVDVPESVLPDVEDCGTDIELLNDDVGVPGGGQPDDSLCRSVRDGYAADWQELISFRPSDELQQMVVDRSNWAVSSYVHPIDRAWGPINLDCYEIVIEELPTVDGETWSAERLLDYMRLHFNEFIDTDRANFEPYDDPDSERFASADPLGSIIHIDMNSGVNVEDGSVVLSDHEADRWRFSTVRMPGDFDHPVSGNREWGFTQADDATIRFYTRGADRPTNALGYAGQSIIFDAAHGLWTSYQQGLTDWINSHGGVASIGAVESEQHDWEEMQQYHQPSTPWLDEDWLTNE